MDEDLEKIISNLQKDTSILGFLSKYSSMELENRKMKDFIETLVDDLDGIDIANADDSLPNIKMLKNIHEDAKKLLKGERT